MTFPILGGNSAVGGYSIDNSLRFNDGDSPTLSRTPASTGNRKTWTFSYWIKRSIISTVQQTFAVGTNASTPWFLNYINSDDTLHIWMHDGTNSYLSTGLNKLRDVGAWYHIMYVVDTTQSTASDRFKVYINGNEMTWNSYNPPAQNFDTEVNTTNAHYIGRAGNGQYFDGYTAETHFIDGQALSPTDFGEFDEDSGIWKPIQYTGSYGTNGFYLDFENSGSLGADQSGNGNNFTPTNLASTDQTTDTPTNNFSTWNPIAKTGSVMTFSEGNLKVVTPTTLNGFCVSSIAIPSTGKWYWEVNALDTNTYTGISVYNPTATHPYSTNNSVLYLSNNGNKYIDGTAGTAYGATYGAGDIIGIACDADADTITFYKNNVSQGAISHTMTDMFPTLADSGSSTVQIVTNFGQDSSFAGNKTRQNNSDSNGKGDFYYAPPSGYLALCTQNLATELSPTIDDGSQYFNTVLYTGTGSTQSITGVGFQPDWLWIKNRSSSANHGSFDSVRGSNKFLYPNLTASEFTGTGNEVSSFDSDGFSISGISSMLNASGDNFASWNWLAGGTGVSNTDGSITSTVSANTTAGFSIVTFTGTTSNQTVGHGLNQAPEIFFVKSRVSTSNFWAYTTVVDGSLDFLSLNTTNASGTASNSAPTSSVIYQNQTDSSVAYCFHSVEGYSKFGSYTGNGSTDGTFVYTGFRPSWVVSKRTDSTSDWLMRDTTRDTYNVTSLFIKANASNAEASSGDIDILSNGFKWRSSTAGQNGSGASYIYMAFAENPFVSSSGVPVTAR